MKRLISKTTVHTAINSLIVASAAGLMMGCATHVDKTVTVNPESLVLTPDINNYINLDATLNIPADYLTSRSMATIEPVLILGDRVAEKMQPIVLYGKVYDKKEKRLEALYGYRDPYKRLVQKVSDTHKPITIQMYENLHLDDNFDSGKIEAYVTKNGCGQCYGVDTLVIAYLSNLSNLIDRNLLVHWVDTILAPVAKTFSGEGTARLQFEVDRTEILPTLANNAAEMDTMLAALTPVIKDPLSTLNKLSIFGSASAEGRYKHNVELAQSRAAAAKDWLDSKLHMTPAQKRLIKIGSEPEGWGPVIASMHAAGDPDSALVKAIVEKYPDIKTGQAERYIRKLKCWPTIAEKHLAKDRRVIYKYDWTIKSFDTDEEVLDMFEKRPDAFSEEEFLRVARLKEPNVDDVINVYETLVKYHPESEIGVNNLATLYYQTGKYDDAIRLLQSQIRPTDDMITTLAVCYSMTGDDQKAMDLLKKLNNEEAVYNLGVLQASNHQMADGYVNLESAQDLNAAIAALGVGLNKEAWAILDKLDENSPKADYVKAIAQARLGNNDLSIRYLKNAIKDDSLKRRAKTEADFRPLHKEWKYQELMND